MAFRNRFSDDGPQRAGDWGESGWTSWFADDNRVEALLGPTHWSIGTIRFSLPTSAWEYEDGFGEYSEENETSTFRQAGSDVKAAAFFALSESQGPDADAAFSLEGFTNLDVSYTRASDANLRYAQAFIDPDAGAWAYYPSDYETGGDIWLNRTENWNAEAGNYAWFTVIHETGHALGLKHPHEGGTILDRRHDSHEYTVMSYKSYRGAPEGYTNGAWDFPQTWMMLDIAALQELYGADFTPNAREVVYSWRPGSGNTWVNGKVAIAAGGQKIFATIWDGGGNVTYDLSAFRGDLVISLEPGAFSVFSKNQLATLKSGGSTVLAQGNIYNGLLHDDDPRSLVRKAIGGTGDDKITGNAAANILDGGSGGDRLNGRDGDDILIGRSGSDTLTGGRGSDTARFVTASAVTVDLDLSGAQRTGEGRDTLSGIENLWGGTGSNRLWGDEGGNRLRGAERADLLNGRGGDDILEGRGGDDLLYGKDGNDRLTGGTGNDLISGGTGNDTAVFGGSVGVMVDLRVTTGQLTGQGRDTLTGIENLEGGDGFDRLTGNDGANRLAGGRGSDVLTGGGGNDRLSGGTGADSFVFVGTIGEDVVEDFSRADGDLITLDSDLWADAGTLDAAEVVDSFAVVEGGRVVLRFAPESEITLNGLSSVSGLADHILIV
jgi:serralysin